MIIIGIDCATDPRKMGLARARYDHGRCTVLDALQGASGDENLKLVARWLFEEQKALLAMDAPLGWPEALGDELVGHCADEPLQGDSNNLFRGETDRAIYRYLKKQPLDVGADRIARTAHAALSFLEELRGVSNHRLALAWSRETDAYSAVSEVYPAATLLAHRLRSTGYKKAENFREREEMMDGLARKMVLPEDSGQMRENADALDAVVCVLAGAGFEMSSVPKPALKTNVSKLFSYDLVSVMSGRFLTAEVVYETASRLCVVAHSFPKILATGAIRWETKDRRD